MRVVKIVRHGDSLRHAPVWSLHMVIIDGSIRRVAMVHVLVLAHDLVVGVVVSMVVLEALLVTARLMVVTVFDDHVLKGASQRNLSCRQLVMLLLLFELSRKMLLIHLRPLLHD